MKTFILTVLALTSIHFSVFSQKLIKGNGDVKIENRKTKNYNQIILLGSPDVKLIDSKQGDIQIQAESNLIPYIETKIIDNKLTIQFKNGTSYSTKKGIKIFVPIENVSKISVKGSGDIEGEHLIINTDLNVFIEGSGDITLSVQNKKINAEVQGSGDLKLKGKTNQFSATVKGSGDIKAKYLNSISSNLNVNGSGDIESSTISSVKAYVKGSGDIKIYGNPTIIEKKINGSGDIKFIK